MGKPEADLALGSCWVTWEIELAILFEISVGNCWTLGFRSGFLKHVGVKDRRKISKGSWGELGRRRGCLRSGMWGEGVWKMESIALKWEIDKHICTEVAEFIQKQIVVKNGTPDPLRPQTRFCPVSLTRASSLYPSHCSQSSFIILL